MTRNVTFGWINSSSSFSENNIPTEWIGKRNLKLGSRNDIDLIVLEGIDKYDKRYTDALENVGYTIVDATKNFHFFSNKYSALNRFGDYEKKCFLRWLVLEELYGNEPVIHYDGDIIFNEIPENLQKRFDKKTFVLQGCPAVASLHTHEWYDNYFRNLDLFINDIERYSSDAWDRRTGWEESWKNDWAGSRYRRIITSDQDLISHLIHVQDLPQESPATLIKDNQDLIFFENPLYFFSHNKEIAPFYYERKGLVDYFNNRKVAFWHLQGYFKEYLQRAYFWNYLLNRRIRIRNILEQSDQSYVRKIENSFLHWIGSPFTHRYSRLDLCRFFFETRDFHNVFNKQTFWLDPNNDDDLKKISYI